MLLSAQHVSSNKKGFWLEQLVCVMNTIIKSQPVGKCAKRLMRTNVTGGSSRLYRQASVLSFVEMESFWDRENAMMETS